MSRKRIAVFGSIISITVVAFSGQALGKDCTSDDLKEQILCLTAEVSRLGGELDKVNRAGNSQETKYGELSKKMTEHEKSHSVVVIPKGAVVAFDLPEGCPRQGWEPLNDASGKFIIGVSSSKRYRESGGSESYSLSVRNRRLLSRPRPGRHHPWRTGPANRHHCLRSARACQTRKHCDP